MLCRLKDLLKLSLLMLCVCQPAWQIEMKSGHPEMSDAGRTMIDDQCSLIDLLLLEMQPELY